MNASTNPTASPNKIPRGTEFTLRAKTPAATPAMRPLMVDPTMIPTIIERTAGVNHAVPPSIAPKTAPNSSPSSTLFMLSSTSMISLMSYTTLSQNPLALPMHKKQDQHPHQQVGGDEKNKEAVTAVKPPQLLENALAVGCDCQAIQVP